MRYLENLSASARLLVRSLAWLLAVGVLAYGVKGLIEPGNEQLGLILTAVLCTGGAVLISLRPLLHAADRSAWNWIAAGASVWALGFWWSLLAPVSDGAAVSFADVLWLSFYPAVYVGVYRLVKGELLRTFRSIWLDGVVGGLTAAALAGSFLLKPLIAFEGGDWLTLAVLSAYPGGDMVLLAFVVGAFALRGWRPGPALALIGAGLTALAAADAVYLMDVAAAPARAGVLTDPLWPFALLLVGFAAWQPPYEKPLCKQRTWRIFFMPIVFTVGSGVVLLFALEHSRAGVLVLAAASILLGVVRIALTCRGMQAISDLSQQALTDELTGLGNRRHILRALTELLQSAQEEKRCLVVMLLDLDRFKEVNDTLGHVAGDALLRALGPRLLRAGLAMPSSPAWAETSSRSCCKTRRALPSRSLARIDCGLWWLSRSNTPESESMWMSASAWRCFRRTETRAARYCGAPTSRCTSQSTTTTGRVSTTRRLTRTRASGYR